MTAWRYTLALSVAVAGWMGTGEAQPLIAPLLPELLLTTQFRTPLAYDVALARLDEYYDAEIGRKGTAAFPLIAPGNHFEIWHDIWVSFEAVDGGTRVTMKRPTDGSGKLLAKTWMLSLAGRIEAPLPLTFKEEPPLHSVEADFYGSFRDLTRVFQAEPAMKALPTWLHAGVLVSASPMVSVILAAAGAKGVHHVTVTAGTTATARQLLGRIQQGVLQPGIYSVLSEESEIDIEIANKAKAKADTAGVTAQAVYIPMMDPKILEGRLREDPEMHKRIAAAEGAYDAGVRIDKAYRKVVLSWTELTGYSKATGKHEGERPLGQGTVAAAKPSPAAGGHLLLRSKLEPLKLGAYRLTLSGESATGETLKIDERTFWFDGKTFEEL